MNPDGSPMTKRQVIVERRGAFKWLPVICSNDLEHGSWWFVWGSLFTALCAIYPIYTKNAQRDAHNDDFLPVTDFDLTWAMVICSGVFFTLGSLAFVRAFSEPPQQPLLHNYKHFQTDELLGAWLFLIGTVPGVPYMLIFFLIQPTAFYFFGMLAAVVFVLASYLFVASCYPSDKKHDNVVLPFFIKVFGPQVWIIKHLANDWMAGTWFFLWANVLLTIGSFLLLLVALGVGNDAQIFVWFSGTLCSFLFLVGSFYYVSGSYPHAQQFYYETGRGHVKSSDDAIAKYQKKMKQQQARDGQKVDYSNRILRLSLAATSTDGYEKLEEDHDHDGVHLSDIEKGRPPKPKRQIDRPKVTDRPGGVAAIASSTSAVSNPLHSNNAHGGKATPKASAEQEKERPGSETPTKDKERPPPVPSTPPPSIPTGDYVHVHDQNAEDDEEEVEDDRQLHENTPHDTKRLDALTSSMKKQTATSEGEGGVKKGKTLR
eukprot:CAMPEP_0173135606 /NCGR_PEP_ID=MMETSP1105-20130129/1994_1 /TAXON_ID=2985 /ORGANISM="Ochromonas sp., Strain BG-1" /LENGTH=485 /DNA_ID=CAMNT_0014047641 /DNA_START=1 /DNA_END=1458 /DNA_ORIENTATION=-